MSAAATWLLAFAQFVKQKPRISQRGHIRVVPSQSTRKSTHLCAKWLAQVSPVFSLHESGGDSFLASVEFLGFFEVAPASEFSDFRSFLGLSVASLVVDGVTAGLVKVRGSAVLNVPNRTLSMSAEKFMIESSTWVRIVLVLFDGNGHRLYRIGCRCRINRGRFSRRITNTMGAHIICFTDCRHVLSHVRCVSTADACFITAAIDATL